MKKLYGALGFVAFWCIPALAEGGQWLASFVCIGACIGLTYLAGGFYGQEKTPGKAATLTEGTRQISTQQYQNREAKSSVQ